MESITEKIKIGQSTIIDVRSNEEFSGGHVAGSINIPVQELPARIEDFENMKKPIILCCASGSRSGMALDFLRSNGIDEVYNGGSWMDVNFLTVSQ